MNIGLYDVDSKNFPNLALMKISAYHKSIGDNVEWLNNFNEYDIVYKSKVFTFSKEDDTIIKSKKIIYGGTGYDLTKKLSNEIEYIYPDYSIYPEYTKNKAYGYLTRGCFRNCKFCIVSDKEGNKSRKVNDLKNFWNGQKEIILLDPNLLDCDNRYELLDQLIDSKSYIDFTQGLDIRLIDDEIIKRIKQLKIKRIHFAWDNKDPKIYENLKYFYARTSYSRSQIIVYVLVNYNTNFEYDLYRIEKIRDIKYSPYIMIYDRNKCEKKYKHLARWVNSNIIFNVFKNFNDYLKYIKK